jgi:citrate lyase subunit beta/citryl-CoA lyase
MSEFDVLRQEIAQIQSKHRARPEMVHGLMVPYFRRGVMAIPALKMKSEGNVETEGREQSLRLMSKAAQMPVDYFFYDLEDAAPDNPHLKTYARQFLIEALLANDYGDRVVAFRPNNIRTSYFEDDLIEVLSKAGHRLQSMVIPKTEHVDEVADVLKVINDVMRISGHTNKIHIEVLIESAQGFLHAENIAKLDGVSALVHGSWDFARTIGGKVTAEGWLMDQAVIRQMLPIIASAYGKDAVDAVTVTLPLRPKKPADLSVEEYKAALKLSSSELDAAQVGEDFVAAMKRKEYAIELCRHDALNARAIGYAAKWILHPDQIKPIHDAWSPGREESLKALKLTADYTAAALAGSGAEVDHDRLADKAVVGTEWWLVRAGLRTGSLTQADIDATGFTYEQLLRCVVTTEAQIEQWK